MTETEIVATAPAPWWAKQLRNRMMPGTSAQLIGFSSREAYSGCCIPGFSAREQRWTCVACWAIFEYLPDFKGGAQPPYQCLCPFCRHEAKRQDLLSRIVQGFQHVCFTRSLARWQDEMLRGQVNGEELGDCISDWLQGPTSNLESLLAYLLRRALC